MTRKTPTNLTPKRRFPEFRDAPVWDEKPLKDVFDTITNGKANAQDHVEDGEFLLFDRSEVIKRSNSYMFDSEAVIIPGEGMRFQPRHFKGKFNLHQRAYALMECKEDCSFIFHALDHSKERLAGQAVKSTVLSLRLPIIETFKVGCPDPAEQRKIADCLGSLDDWIAAAGRKLAALRDHKRGLLQQLFPPPGQSQPPQRFPEFRKAGKWKQIPLGNFADIKLGKMLDKNKHRSGRRLPYLNNLSVRWNDFDTSDLPEMFFGDDEIDRYDLKAGDVIVCEGGEPGRAAVWDERLKGIKFQKALHRVRFKAEFIPSLLVSYLERIAGTTEFEALFTGGGIKHLTRETFARLPIPVPAPAEQQKIAACLTALDARIAAEAEKLDTLHQHKRGLMQQLFPSPEGT